MSKKKTKFGESLMMNNRTYTRYLVQLSELAISMFEWENLPDGIDPRFMELILFCEGKVVFFHDDDMDEYLALQCVVDGGFNVYRIPIRRRAFSVNGYSKKLDIKNSVIIYNNMLRLNTYPTVELFARRLWDLDRAIDTNAKAQKTPVLIQATEQQRLTMLNLYEQYDGNEPFIYGDKNLDVNGIKSIKTDAPYVADKLYQLKTQIWNEAMTFLGISNLNIQKKERLVSDEVTRSLGGTIASRYSRLTARKMACEEINKMFGLNIDVKYREDYREIDDEFMIDPEQGTISASAIDLRTRGSIGGQKGVL